MVTKCFLSGREHKPCAASDRFPCLSLSQSLLLFTQNQHPHIQNPLSKLSAPIKFPNSSQRTPKELPKNSQRVPKNVPKITQKIPKEFPLNSPKIPQKSQKIQEFPKSIHLTYKLPENISRAYWSKSFLSL